MGSDINLTTYVRRSVGMIRSVSSPASIGFTTKSGVWSSPEPLITGVISQRRESPICGWLCKCSPACSSTAQTLSGAHTITGIPWPKT